MPTTAAPTPSTAPVPGTNPTSTPLLASIHSPADLKALPIARLPELAAEMRRAICEQVSRSGGHLAPNLGVVGLTIALHYVCDFSPDLAAGPGGRGPSDCRRAPDDCWSSRRTSS